MGANLEHGDIISSHLHLYTSRYRVNHLSCYRVTEDLSTKNLAGFALENKFHFSSGCTRHDSGVAIWTFNLSDNNIETLFFSHLLSESSSCEGKVSYAG